VTEQTKDFTLPHIEVEDIHRLALAEYFGDAL
jgi:hypothetical protein